MNKRYNQFTKISYSGVELLKNHSLDEDGVWEIRGEDPNCDWGGFHHEPKLGFVSGKLRDVIKEAVKMPQFWSWGAGGTIKKITPKLVHNLSEVKKLVDKKKKLEDELKEINKLLEE